MTMARRHRHGLGPPAVRPLDVDGVRTVAIGTVLWAIAFVVLVLFRDDLDAEGLGWWIWTCLAGVGLGLLGLEYARKRRDAIARARLREEADREDEPLAAEPEAEPVVAPVESEPVRAEGPEPVHAEPVPGRDMEPAPVEPARLEPARMEPESAPVEPARLEPEPALAHGQPQPEPDPRQVIRELARVELQPVVVEPELPAAEISPPVRADPPRLEVTTSEWEEAGLLDIGPPVPGPSPASRRARRATRTDEPVDDLDEPLLPIRDDWRRVDDEPSTAPQIGDEYANEDELDDGEAGYHGRRARRP